MSCNIIYSTKRTQIQRISKQKTKKKGVKRKEKGTKFQTSSKSTPHSAAMFRIKSDALESAAKIKSCPESTKSKIPSKSNDPPNPTQSYNHQTTQNTHTHTHTEAYTIQEEKRRNLRSVEGEKRMSPSYKYCPYRLTAIDGSLASLNSRLKPRDLSAVKKMECDDLRDRSSSKTRIWRSVG